MMIGGLGDGLDMNEEALAAIGFLGVMVASVAHDSRLCAGPGGRVVGRRGYFVRHKHVIVWSFPQTMLK